MHSIAEVMLYHMHYQAKIEKITILGGGES